MDLWIDGAARTLIPIRQFRVDHALPDTFCVDYFTPKDWTGLGRVDTAGAELNSLRTALLAGLPAHLTPLEWMRALPDFVQQFDKGLRAINPQVGLRESELEFAAAGFSDVLRAHAIALIQRQGQPAFDSVYAQWLWDSVRVFSEGYPYPQPGENWQVHIISHAYGRIGLRVTTPDAVCFVYDPALACPAEGYMQGLLEAIGNHIEALVSPQR